MTAATINDSPPAPPPVDAVTAALATAATLQRRLDECHQTLATVDAERIALSFAAHGGDDDDAKRKLSKLNARRAVLITEAEELDAAVDTARQNVIETQNAANADAARQRAAEAEPIARRLAERGAAMDATVAAFVEHYRGINDDINALMKLGIPTPSRELVSVNLNRARDAAFNGLDPSVRPVPVLQRHSYQSLTNGWSAPALAYISDKITTYTAADAA